MHVVESINVKQTPSNCERIEMSALIEQRNVVNQGMQSRDSCVQ